MAMRKRERAQKGVAIGGRAVFLTFALAFALGGCASATKDMQLVDRGAGAFVAGDPAEAERQLRAALEINPDNGYALITLAAVFERTGRMDEARKLYAEAAARGGAAGPGPLGVEGAERAALAALARERLVVLAAGGAAGGEGETSARDGAPGAETVETVFANLARVSDDLRRLSAALDAKPAMAGMAAAPARSSAPRAPAGAPILLVPPASASATTAGGAPASEPLAKPAATRAATTANGIHLHLASYRTKTRARKGWREAVARYGDLLAGLDHSIVRVDLGHGMGIYYRVLAGPVSGEDAARALCARFKSRGAYCALVFPERTVEARTPTLD